MNTLDAVPFTVAEEKSKNGRRKRLYIIKSMPVSGTSRIQEFLDQHFSYIHELEKDKALFAAGPLDDADTTTWSGGGLLIFAAPSMEAARALADKDPFHLDGIRKYTLRQWLLNEGTVDPS